MGTEIVAVPFGEDEILATQDEQGKVWVIPRRICESLGTDFAGQFKKLRSLPWSGISLITIPDARGCQQETCVIPLDRFPMWLATIHISKVEKSVREKLKRYQVEAADALAKHFLGTSQSQRDLSPRPIQADPIKSMLLAALETRDKQLQLEGDLQSLQREHLKITCAIEAAEARLIEAEEQVGEAIRRAEEARKDADRAVRTVTSEADCFTLVTWAEGQGVKLVPPHDSTEGKRISSMCRAAGVIPGRISTTRHPIKPDGSGGVQVYPAEMLRPWLVDYLRRNPLQSEA